LYEGDCSPFVSFATSISIEIVLAIIGSGEDGEEQHFLNPLSPQGYINGIQPLSDDEVMAGEPAEPYGEISLAEDQLKYVIHKLEFSNETYETPTKKLEYEFLNAFIFIVIIIGVQTILTRKSRKNN
jgi:hypothetical protein